MGLLWRVVFPSAVWTSSHRPDLNRPKVNTRWFCRFLSSLSRVLRFPRSTQPIEGGRGAARVMSVAYGAIGAAVAVVCFGEKSWSRFFSPPLCCGSLVLTHRLVRGARESGADGRRHFLPVDSMCRHSHCRLHCSAGLWRGGHPGVRTSRVVC